MSVVTTHIIRSARRWAVVWGVVFGLTVISSIQSIVRAYPSISSREQLAKASQTFTFITGHFNHLDTAAGYAVYKVLMTAAIIGAIWGLRTACGLLRGQEESGQWELLLVGRTTHQRATIQALLGLGVVFVAMFAATTIVTIIAGGLPGAHFSPGAAVFFALAMVSGAGMFLAIGALASQLAATSGQAATISTIVLGVSYAIRVVADSSTSTNWICWFSPLGWIEELRPLEDTQPIALVPIAITMVACCVATIVLAGRRDLNASILQDSEGRLGHPRWPRFGAIGLDFHVNRTSALAWLMGVAAMAALLGYATRAYSQLLNGSPSLMAALGRFGIRQVAEGFMGLEFFMLEIMVAVVAATQLAAMRDEEASGRLDNLLVRPVSRQSWLAGRVGISLLLVLAAGQTAGFFAWLGSATQHTGVPLETLLQAGLNGSVPAVFVIGAGTFVLGVRPQLTAAAGYAIIAWSTLVDLLAALLKNADWLKDSSLFTHIALAPAAKPDWGNDIIMVLLGLGLAAVGAIAFQRRDVEYA